MDKLYLFLFFFIAIILSACTDRVVDPIDNDSDSTANTLVQKVGSDDTFEIMTWNIENFPGAGMTTVNNVKTLIRNLDVDLIAVQEIVSTSSFETLVDSLDGWNGILNSYPDAYSGYQHTGVLYKSDQISVSNPSYILEQYSYYFASRPPFAAFIEVRDANNQTVFDFNIIVVHLKAFDDGADRRENSIYHLEEYIQTEIDAGADPDFIVLGDWNDQLTDDESENVFTAFSEDTAHYSFLTQAIGGKSYISTTYSSLIDHILITSDTRTEYGEGETKVLYLDNEFRKYPSEVSDHRPVAAIFKGFNVR